MKQTIAAVFEKGSFHPIDAHAVVLADGQRVQITIDDGGEPLALRLAMKVYDGLTTQDIEEVERLALERPSFFGTRSAG